MIIYLRSPELFKIKMTQSKIYFIGDLKRSQGLRGREKTGKTITADPGLKKNIPNLGIVLTGDRLLR